jgi:putative membrane protein
VSVADLPTLNALLNVTATLLLVLGWRYIKARRVAEHRRVMIAAFCTSALFLVSYVTYHAQAGSRPFTGTGVLRTVYFAILIPHIVLAAAVLPLAIVTLRRGLVRSDAAHRRIARITLPVWLFVSVTGVVLNVLL